mmetsp:Transcript_37028/g.78179  ORF Transcript_37028/g.78179 Transcript_37028/m.78179 type:complete len:787 (-) Transcript_37028:505-2865(-)
MNMFRNKLSKGLSGSRQADDNNGQGQSQNNNHASSHHAGHRSDSNHHHHHGGGGGYHTQHQQQQPSSSQRDVDMADAGDDGRRGGGGGGTSSSSSGKGGFGGFMRKKSANTGGSNVPQSSHPSPSSASGQQISNSTGSSHGASINSSQGGGMRVKKSNINRRAIRASAIAIDDGPVEGPGAYVPPVIPKSDSAKRLIYNAIKNNVLFRACSTEELKDLIDAFSAAHRQKGSIVIREGDHGDGFYVLSNGSVSVYEATEFKGTLHPGMGFGEIALLYSCPRTATVKAREDVDMWFMDRRAFRVIIARHKRKVLNMKLMLLEKVKIHDKKLVEILKPHEFHSVAMASQFKEFSQGQVIIRQGDMGDAFYMIASGAVDVYVREKSETHPVVTLKAGAFFGEKALLNSDVRTATCVASARSSEEVKCMYLVREDFVRMLGDLETLMDRSYENRDDSDKAGRGMGEPEGKIDSGEVHPSGPKFIKDDFDIKRTLGVGAYGFVKLVRWNRAPPAQQNFYYALKCVSKQKIEEKKQQQKIKREEDIMKSLIHPFIARCYNVMEDVKGKYFLMEALCGGELCELLYFENKFSEDWSMFYSASVLAAFAHMHERKVAYRDLKPENLVLDNSGYVKIVDFGLAKVIKNGQTYTFCGTPDYLAPEVILSEGHDWAVDYWGLGVLIYEMTEGVAPFYAENPMDTYRKALSGQVHIPDHFTVVVANLIKKLLHTDQSKRLGRTVGGTTAIMCHRWFSNFDWDALLEYRMEAPYLPEEKDPDHMGSDMDGDVEGFASDFL